VGLIGHENALAKRLWPVRAVRAEIYTASRRFPATARLLFFFLFREKRKASSACARRQTGARFTHALTHGGERKVAHERCRLLIYRVRWPVMRDNRLL